MRWFQNLSFRKKLAAGFFVAGLIPLLVCILFLTFTVKSIVNKEQPDTSAQQFESLNATFSNFLDSINSNLLSLKSNETIISFLSEETSKDFVYNAQQNSGRFFLSTDFALYDKNGGCLYASSGKRLFGKQTYGDLPVNWGILRAARGGSEVVWRKNTIQNSSEVTFSAAITIRKETRVIGYIVISILESSFNSLFRGKYSPNSQIFVVDGYWNNIFSTISTSEQTDKFKNDLFSGLSIPQRTQDSVYFIRKHKKSDFYLILQQSKPISDSARRPLFIAALVSILSSVILYTFFSKLISRQFFDPIQKLNGAMILVEKGNLDIELKTKRIDELGQITQRFNRTVKKLKKYMEEIINRQKELNDTQIRMMQAQLNPHFLYNTLDTVKWIAKINKINTAATIATDLADILRLSISEEELIPLDKELKMLDRYIEIQKIRFPNKFEFKTEIDDSIRDLKVPKLMLQPLIENSILHGFEEINEGLITVTAEKISDEVVINVIDNGTGISKEAVNMIQSHEGLAKGHLGLYNVDAILRLHYGKKYGLHFIPMQTSGTCIRIILPL